MESSNTHGMDAFKKGVFTVPSGELEAIRVKALKDGKSAEQAQAEVDAEIAKMVTANAYRGDDFGSKPLNKPPDA